MDIEQDGSSIEEESKAVNTDLRGLSLADKCRAYLYSEEGQSYASIARTLSRLMTRKKMTMMTTRR